MRGIGPRLHYWPRSGEGHFCTGSEGPYSVNLTYLVRYKSPKNDLPKSPKNGSGSWFWVK
jgi:hypothetical protein